MHFKTHSLNTEGQTDMWQLSPWPIQHEGEEIVDIANLEEGKEIKGYLLQSPIVSQNQEGWENR